MRIAATLIALPLALTACSVPDDARGTVTAFNGEFVTIRGGMNQVRGKPGFTPTSGMVAQAAEVCRSDAVFQGTAIPDNDPTGVFINYNFLCR